MRDRLSARRSRRAGRFRRPGGLPDAVVVGDAPEVLAIAARLPHDLVAVIGERSNTDSRRLRAKGVDVVGGFLDECPPRLFRRTREAVIAGSSDAVTMEWVRQFLEYPDLAATLRPFVDDGALAAVLDRHDRISALHRPAIIARAVAAAHPPTLPDRVCPPPIVIGSGAVARELVTRLVIGWGQAGEPMTVHCFGTDSSGWASAAAVELGSRGRISWTKLPLAPASVLAHLASLSENWQAPPITHATTAGSTIYVALEPEVGVPLAMTLAQHLPDARVAVLSPDAEPWNALHNESDGEVLSTSAMLVAAVVNTEPVDDSLIAEQLLADAALSAGQTLLGRLRMDGRNPAPLSEQPDEVGSRIAALAGAFEDLLGAGGVVVSPMSMLESEPIVLTPGDLLRMSGAILHVWQMPGTQDNRLQALEFASRLPVVAARAGFAPHRAKGVSSSLSADALELLAPLVHHAYQQVGHATNNATGSPWLYETWDGLQDYEKSSNRAVLTGSPVGYAMEGLDWVISDDPVVMEFNQDRVERLAALEHRRWVDHQRRNGRPEHTFVVPWRKLEPDKKEYDRAIVRALPHLLAHAGIQLAEQDPARPPLG